MTTQPEMRERYRAIVRMAIEATRAYGTGRGKSESGVPKREAEDFAMRSFGIYRPAAARYVDYLVTVGDLKLVFVPDSTGHVIRLLQVTHQGTIFVGGDGDSGKT